MDFFTVSGILKSKRVLISDDTSENQAKYRKAPMGLQPEEKGHEPQAHRGAAKVSYAGGPSWHVSSGCRWPSPCTNNYHPDLE